MAKNNKVADAVSLTSRYSHTGSSITKLLFGNRSKKYLRSKKFLFAKFILLFFIPVGMLLGVMSIGAVSSVDDHILMAGFKADLETIFDLNIAIGFLQDERCMYGKSIVFDSEAVPMPELSASYSCGNSTLELSSLLNQHDIDATGITSQRQLSSYFKDKADETLHNSSRLSSAISIYNDAILTLTKQLTVLLKRNKYGDIWQALMPYLMIVKAREQLEVERLIGMIFFSNETLTKQLFLLYSKAISVGTMTFRASERYISKLNRIQIKCFEDDDCLDRLGQTRKSIQLGFVAKTSSAGLLEDGLSYLADLSTLNGIWKNITSQIELLVVDVLEGIETTTNNNIILNVVSCCITIIIIPVTLKSILRVINQLQASMEQISQQASLLNMEKRKADLLLTQMLPPQVADNLKNRKPVKAETFDEATILFTDVVDFMKYTTMMEPVNIVHMLNSLYSCFDARIKLYDVYKVETIGEVYMCVSGIPKRNGKQHAGEIASLALHFQRGMVEIKVPGFSDIKLELKAGINTGPVTAGVVGLATPRYCLFGDTVNTASRMESNCLPGKIQITQRTGRLLTELGGFNVTPRGQVEIKGKGKMMTYWLLSRKGYGRSGGGGDKSRRISAASLSYGNV